MCESSCGINTIGRVASDIAKFFNLKDPDSYTGHASRRTSDTLLADIGAEILSLKRHSGWETSSIAEIYVEDSIRNEIEFFEKIFTNKNNIGTRMYNSATTSSETTIP